jgi:hypothetical protein
VQLQFAVIGVTECVIRNVREWVVIFMPGRNNIKYLNLPFAEENSTIGQFPKI